MTLCPCLPFVALSSRKLSVICGTLASLSFASFQEIFQGSKLGKAASDVLLCHSRGNFQSRRIETFDA